MQKITKRLHDSVIKSFRPMIEKMAADGCTKSEIVSAYQNQIRIKSLQYYARQKEPKSFRECFNLEALEKADSKIEMIFYESLSRHGIPFKFQVKIGPYRADYLIKGEIIVEIDGPDHNKTYDAKRDRYLRKMGYKIIRVPTWVLVSCPDAIIDEIREIIKQ